MELRKPSRRADILEETKNDSLQIFGVSRRLYLNQHWQAARTQALSSAGSDLTCEGVRKATSVGGEGVPLYRHADGASFELDRAVQARVGPCSLGFRRIWDIKTPGFR